MRPRTMVTVSEKATKPDPVLLHKAISITHCHNSNFALTVFSDDTNFAEQVAVVPEPFSDSAPIYLKYESPNYSCCKCIGT